MSVKWEMVSHVIKANPSKRAMVLVDGLKNYFGTALLYFPNSFLMLGAKTVGKEALEAGIMIAVIYFTAPYELDDIPEDVCGLLCSLMAR